MEGVGYKLCTASWCLLPSPCLVTGSPSWLSSKPGGPPASRPRRHGSLPEKHWQARGSLVADFAAGCHSVSTPAPGGVEARRAAFVTNVECSSPRLRAWVSQDLGRLAVKWSRDVSGFPPRST